MVQFFFKRFSTKIFLRLQKKLNCYGIKGKENYKNKSYMGFFFSKSKRKTAKTVKSLQTR